MPDLNQLTPDQFENLTLDLMQLLGLKNCVWRTPGRDGGRDIQGEYFFSDFSGFIKKDIWYVECKRYTDTVSWPTVWEKIAYADSNSADILLFVTSSTLSPQAVDEVNRWNASQKKPSIRFWSGQDILDRLKLFPQASVKYGLSTNPITDAAISILPTTKLLTKYANTGSAYSAFGKNREKIDDVIHALSELISARIEEIEIDGKTAHTPFTAEKDGYPWLTESAKVESSQLDRYAARALLSMIRCHSEIEGIEISDDLRKLTITSNAPCSESFHDDLRTVAFWGESTIHTSNSDNRIEITNEHT